MELLRERQASSNTRAHLTVSLRAKHNRVTGIVSSSSVSIHIASSNSRPLEAARILLPRSNGCRWELASPILRPRLILRIMLWSLKVLTIRSIHKTGQRARSMLFAALSCTVASGCLADKAYVEFSWQVS